MVSTVKLSRLWESLGYQVDIVCMHTTENSEKPVKLSERRTIQFKRDFFLSDPWNYGISWGFSKLVRKRVREEKPDFIVVNKLLFWTSLSLIPLALSGKKVILLVDALVGMTWWPRGRLPQVCAAIYAWTIGWIILLLASQVIFFHPQPPKLLRFLGISKKSKVIPTGIDADPFNDAEKIRERESSINVTYVGRLESIKGVDDFLAAIVPLKKKFPQLTIQVAGWAKPDHPLVLQYKHDVDFMGHCGDVATLLAKTHIFVLPSHSEGLSNALMEAMASACACIASEVGGNRYLIQNGVSGFLYPAGDRAALASHVYRLIEDATKRRMLGTEARQRIIERFDWKVVGKMYQELFDTFTIRSGDSAISARVPSAANADSPLRKI